MLRPDAIGYVGEVGNGVEVRVTHEVDGDKQAYLARLLLPSVEVDLAALVGKVFTFDALEAAVITSIENKRWLFHPQQAAGEAQLLAGFEDWRQARLADLARLKERSIRPPAPRPGPTDVYKAANEKYRALPAKEKWERLERKLGVQRKDFPSHLRVSLKEGGDAVLADKDLWQGAVFVQFVLGAGTEDKLGKRMPNEGVLSVWLAQRFGVKGGEEAARPAARFYLNYLRACGFLRKQGFDLYVAHNQLAAPVKEPATSPLSPRELSAPSIQWRDTWPDDERLRQWATEASKSGGGFAADWFVGWLLSLDAPPTLEEAQSAFFEAKGNPEEMMTALRGMGVVVNTWRYFSYGEAAPWVDV